MRKLVVLLGIVAVSAAAAGALATTARADRVVITPIPVQEANVPSRFFSNLCGYPLNRYVEGTFKEMDFYDSSGTLVRQQFRSDGRFTITVTNPATGKSVTTQQQWQETFLFAPDGSLISLRRSGVFFNFHGPGGGGSLLIVAGHESYTVATDEASGSGPNDLATGDVAAFCDYLATP